MRLTLLATALLVAYIQSADVRAQAPKPVPFSEALGRDNVLKIVRDERTTFVDTFTLMTKVQPKVTSEFDGNVADRVLPVQVVAPTPAAAEGILRIRFRLFLSNLTAYLLATTKEVVLDVAAVNRYLEAGAIAKKCGEVPCPMSCAEGKPCDLRCNPCRAGQAQ